MRWAVVLTLSLAACVSVSSQHSPATGGVIATASAAITAPPSEPKSNTPPLPSKSLAPGVLRIHASFPAADQPLLLEAPEGCQFQSPSRAFDDSFARWLMNCPALFNPRIGSTAELIAYARQQGWTTCAVAGGSVWFVRDDVVLALAFSQPIVVEQRIRLTECPSVPPTRGARERMR